MYYLCNTMFIIGTSTCMYNLYYIYKFLSLIHLYGFHYQVGLETIWLNNCEKQTMWILYPLLKHIAYFGCGVLMYYIAIAEPLATIRFFIRVIDILVRIIEVIFDSTDKLRKKIQTLKGIKQPPYIPRTFQEHQVSSTLVGNDSKRDNTTTKAVDNQRQVHVNTVFHHKGNDNGEGDRPPPVNTASDH